MLTMTELKKMLELASGRKLSPEHHFIIEVYFDQNGNKVSLDKYFKGNDVIKAGTLVLRVRSEGEGLYHNNSEHAVTENFTYVLKTTGGGGTTPPGEGGNDGDPDPDPDKPGSGGNGGTPGGSGGNNGSGSGSGSGSGGGFGSGSGSGSGGGFGSGSGTGSGDGLGGSGMNSASNAGNLDPNNVSTSALGGGLNGELPQTGDDFKSEAATVGLMSMLAGLLFLRRKKKPTTDK